MDRPQRDSLSQDLSEALKEATKEVHTQEENAEFMRNFQKGQVTRKGFKLVMASLYQSTWPRRRRWIECNKDNPGFDMVQPSYSPLFDNLSFMFISSFLISFGQCSTKSISSEISLSPVFLLRSVNKSKITPGILPEKC
uniref:Heme oxygenase 1 n=1 Tax=Urocitellus parryii TaxID=9999 RepID=A0A8D2I041_UROPR